MSKREDLNEFFQIENEELSAQEQSGENDFQDISSSASEDLNAETYSLFDFAKNGKYNKKAHGFWGKLCKWWKNRKTWQKSVMITGVSLILVIAIALGVLLNVFDYNYNEIDVDDLGIENVVNKDIVNVALFGIDTRDTTSFKGNSDSIMILSLNTLTSKVKIISVMRDTLVPIEHNNKKTYSKINSAYASGGPELAIKTINTIFNLDISEYATVNFYGMADIIDAVGGIDAELTSAEVVSARASSYAINGCIEEICGNLDLNAKDYYITNPGQQHLNGVQAVAYSRIRYVANIWGTNNDYGRTDRQRYVMEQLFNKALTLGKSQYVKLVKSLIPCSETSLSYSEIMNLAFSILLNSPSFEQTRIPQQEFLMTAPTNTGAGSVVYYDLEYAAKIIHAFIYDDITLEKYVEENGIEKNDWYSKRYSSGGSGNRRPTQNSTSGSEKTSSTSNTSQGISNPSGTSSEKNSIGGSGSTKPSDGSSSGSQSSQDDTTDKDSTTSQGNSSDNTVTSDKDDEGTESSDTSSSSSGSQDSNSDSSGSGGSGSSSEDTDGTDSSSNQESDGSKDEGSGSGDGDNDDQTSPPQSQEPTKPEDNSSSPNSNGAEG